MNKIKAFIERGNDGTYGIYVDLEDNTLNYGIIGEGSTAQEAIEDFKTGYIDMRVLYKEEGRTFVEADFEFCYDTASFLNYYSKFFSLAGLSRLTGIHQGQLSHYLNGHRRPSKKTVEKIESSLQVFGKEISQVEFV
jgi:Helix-turn-helix.